MELIQAMSGTMSRVSIKHYGANGFFNLDLDSNNFSLLYLNITFLTKHYEELRTLLGQLGRSITIIGITDTEFQSNFPLLIVIS